MVYDFYNKNRLRIDWTYGILKNSNLPWFMIFQSCTMHTIYIYPMHVAFPENVWIFVRRVIPPLTEILRGSCRRRSNEAALRVCIDTEYPLSFHAAILLVVLTSLFRLWTRQRNNRGVSRLLRSVRRCAVISGNFISLERHRLAWLRVDRETDRGH